MVLEVGKGEKRLNGEKRIWRRAGEEKGGAEYKRQYQRTHSIKGTIIVLAEGGRV